MTRPLLIALLVLAPALAIARPRVAVMKLENDSSGAVGDLVAEVLESDTVLIGTKEVNRTVDKLGLPDELTDRDVKKLATELDADVLVRGKINKKGENHVAHFKVFVRGKRKGFSVEYSNLKSDKLKTALHDKFLEKISGASASATDEESEEHPAKADDEEDHPKKIKKGDDEDREAKRGDDEEDHPKKIKKGDDEEREAKRGDDEEDRPKKIKKGDDEERDDRGDRGDREARDDEDRPRKKKRTARRDDEEGDDVELRGSSEGVTASKVIDLNHDALRVDVGASATQRTLQYQSRAFEQAPKPYKNSPVPGVRLAGELYPFALSNRNGALAGLGIGGSYDKTMSLKVQTTEQPGTKFPVTEQRWNVGVRYRVPFGSSGTSPSVILGLGYTTNTFLISRAALVDNHKIDVPDVNYRGYHLGVDARFPFTPAVSLFAGGRAILVSAAGPIQKNDSYGQAKITALDAAVGLDIIVAKRFVIRLEGDFAQYGYAFTGTGMETNNRDGDPTTKDIGGAADRYLGGAGTFGFLY